MGWSILALWRFDKKLEASQNQTPSVTGCWPISRPAPTEMAREAGAILASHFGHGKLEVEFKDEKQRDPVTNADKECQELLEGAIARHFPDHGVLGEEGEDEDKEAEDSPAPDFVWVLDPLDGTKNFMGGLPVYASSVGVMHRGVPIVGAVFVPWPSDGGGVVLHARTGGGAFADDEPISVADSEEPRAQLAGDPSRLLRRRVPLPKAYERQGGRGARDRQHRL